MGPTVSGWIGDAVRGCRQAPHGCVMGHSPKLWTKSATFAAKMGHMFFFSLRFNGFCAKPMGYQNRLRDVTYLNTRKNGR